MSERQGQQNLKRLCFRAGVSENHIMCGQGQICRVSSLLFLGVSPVTLFLKIWTNCTNCRMLTAATTEPMAPGTGVGHICGSCIGKAWYVVDYKTRAGWSALKNRLPKKFISGGCKRIQGEVHWIGFKWGKKKKTLKEKCHEILSAFKSKVFPFELFKGSFSVLLFQRYFCFKIGSNSKRWVKGKWKIQKG